MTERDLREVLSRNIKRFRAYNKISQEELAEKAEISIPFLSDIENGKKWLSSRTLAKIAEALEIDVHELLRPETAVPDTNVNVIKKYTLDVQEMVCRDLEALQKNFIAKLNNKKIT